MFYKICRGYVKGVMRLILHVCTSTYFIAQPLLSCIHAQPSQSLCISFCQSSESKSSFLLVDCHSTSKEVQTVAFLTSWLVATAAVCLCEPGQAVPRFAGCCNFLWEFLWKNNYSRYLYLNLVKYPVCCVLCTEQWLVDDATLPWSSLWVYRYCHHHLARSCSSSCLLTSTLLDLHYQQVWSRKEKLFPNLAFSVVLGLLTTLNAHARLTPK